MCGVCAGVCGVFVALVRQHAMRMSRVVICGLSGYTEIVVHYLKKNKIFGKNYVRLFSLSKGGEGSIQMFSYYYLNFWSYEVSFVATRETVVLPATAHPSVTDTMELCTITVCLSV